MDTLGSGSHYKSLLGALLLAAPCFKATWVLCLDNHERLLVGLHASSLMPLSSQKSPSDHAHPRAFALAVLSAWTAISPDVFTSSDFCSNANFSDTPS